MINITNLFHLLVVFSSVAVAFDPRLLFTRGDHISAKKDGLNRLHVRAPEQCQPFRTTFTSASDLSSSFVGVSPPGTFETSDRGLHLSLQKPGSVQRNGNVNSAVGQGATVNSTFTMLYGKVTFRVQAPPIAGVVTAAILIADQGDEIDVELLGSDCARFQSNIFAPKPSDRDPQYGLGEVHTVGYGGYITNFNNYTIDWTEERIEWSINNRIVRTLTPAEANINGQQRYPSHPARIQLGIWDASSPAGTSEWAGGPIDWPNAPSTIVATVNHVTVECH